MVGGTKPPIIKELQLKQKENEHGRIGYKKVRRIVRGAVCTDELPVVRRLSPAEIVSRFICGVVMTGLIYSVLVVLIGSAPAIQ